MKTKIILLFLLLLTTTLHARTNELKIHIFKAPGKLSWDSINGLLLSTAKNTILKKKYPIGHFAVELKCEAEEKNIHILTGMTRLDPKSANKTVRKKKLGLGILTYGFDGRLESSGEIQEKIEQLTKKKRYRSVSIDVSPKKCAEMTNFLKNWIENESYSIYGGGKNVEEGEGAGCSDFAEMFYLIATGEKFPDSWVINKKFPVHLIGTEERTVSMLKLLTRKSFANESTEDYIDFRIADPTQAFLYSEDALREGVPDDGTPYREIDVRDIEENETWRSIQVHSFK